MSVYKEELRVSYGKPTYFPVRLILFLRVFYSRVHLSHSGKRELRMYIYNCMWYFILGDLIQHFISLTFLALHPLHTCSISRDCQNCLS